MSEHLPGVLPKPDRFHAFHIAGVIATALIGVLALTVWQPRSSPSADTRAEAVVARCDRLAQIASNRIAEGRGNARNADRRRERQRAFQICLDGPDHFERHFVNR